MQRRRGGRAGGEGEIKEEEGEKTREELTDDCSPTGEHDFVPSNGGAFHSSSDGVEKNKIKGKTVRRREERDKQMVSRMYGIATSRFIFPRSAQAYEDGKMLENNPFRY
jgi:hypothetical protein